MTLVRLALRDLRHQGAFTFLFVLNLALGLSGALVLDALQGSVERTLAARSRSFLAADVRVAGSRALSGDERAQLDALAQPVAVSDVTQLYTMVSGNTHTRLVEVRAIDDHFPLAGSLVLEDGGEPTSDLRERLRVDNEAWVDPALLGQLGISLGDSARIGAKSFRVVDVIARDTGLSVRATSLAPRLYISSHALADTGLLQTGSRIEYQHLLSLAPGTDARSVAGEMRGVIDDARVRITSHDEASEEISRVYDRVIRYLGLTSLVALALAGVACAYLFRAFLRRRLPDLAILMSLGARRRRAHTLLVLELLVLAGAAAALSVVMVAAGLPLLAGALRELLPAHTRLGVGAREAATALAIALVVGPVSCLPFLARLRSLRVAELFQEHADLALRRAKGEALWYLPSALVLFLLAAWRTSSLKQGAYFVLAIGVAFVLTATLGRLVLAAVASLGTGRSVATRLALRQLAPHRRGSVTAFVALALSALLLGLPPQLRALLDEQLYPPGEKAIPSLFLFDIQPEQAGPLRELVEREGTVFQRLAPMVRARLDGVNGESVAAGARGPRRLAFRDRVSLRARRYNLTYQDTLHETETLVEGRAFSGPYDESAGTLPEVSMETDFARRLGVGLGDTLSFDIQGVPVEGRVVNLRKVDWTSMQPNFFVSFQTGVLEGAPAVFLASVPSLPREQRERLQASIVDAFPNVSLIDVSRGVARILNLLDQLQWAIAATAWTSLAVGLALIFAIARDEAYARRWDINLMKVLGARHALLRRSIALEFALLGLTATAVGQSIGLALCAVLSGAVLDLPWSASWFPVLVALLVLPTVTASTATLAMRAVLRGRPQLALN